MSTFAALLTAHPDAVERLIAEHVPDDHGRCRRDGSDTDPSKVAENLDYIRHVPRLAVRRWRADHTELDRGNAVAHKLYGPMYSIEQPRSAVAIEGRQTDREGYDIAGYVVFVCGMFEDPWI